jgi:hypothetical protein
MRFLVVVALLLAPSLARAGQGDDGEPSEPHKPTFSIGVSRGLSIDEYVASITQVRAGVPVDRAHGLWAIASYGTGDGAGVFDGGTVSMGGDLNEGSAGVQGLWCYGAACGTGIVNVGYQREHHSDFDGLVADDPWEVRRHRWFGEWELGGRLWIQKWVALEVGAGLRYEVATVYDHANRTDLAIVGNIGLAVTP